MSRYTDFIFEFLRILIIAYLVLCFECTYDFTYCWMSPLYYGSGPGVSESNRSYFDTIVSLYNSARNIFSQSTLKLLSNEYLVSQGSSIWLATFFFHFKVSLRFFSFIVWSKLILIYQIYAQYFHQFFLCFLRRWFSISSFASFQKLVSLVFVANLIYFLLVEMLSYR